MAYRYFLLWILLLLTPTVYGDNWKVLLYIEASDGLSDMAFKSITDIIRAKPHDTLDIAIQLHAYNNTALRYFIHQEKLEFVDEVVVTNDSKKNLIDAAHWGFNNSTSSDHTLLILSNHGWGILDPEWSEEKQQWDIIEASTNCNPCVIKTPLEKEHENHKGCMFSLEPRTYLNNYDMNQALGVIKHHILKGKKIDILAFDTCMGSMLEICYQTAPYAEYLLGSQSCALKEGFDYHDLITVLNQEQNTPKIVVQKTIEGLDRYYANHDPANIYTFAAIDLSSIQSVRQALDNALEHIFNVPHCELFLQEARSLAPRFCWWPVYTDLVSFCKIIETINNNGLHFSPALIESLHNLYRAVKKSVIALCAGSATQQYAHGYSVYLPNDTKIHASYSHTLFARQSQWLQLIQLICKQPLNS